MFENKLAANISDSCQSLGLSDKSKVLSSLATQRFNELQGLRGFPKDHWDFASNRVQAYAIVNSLVRGSSAVLSDEQIVLDDNTVGSISIQKQEELARFWEQNETTKDVMRAFVHGCVADVLRVRQSVLNKMLEDKDSSNS